LNKGKIVLICGKIGSGKTTYANKICKELNAVNFSQDEPNITIFGTDFYLEQPDLFSKYSDKICEWVQTKALEIAQAGANVVIENGVWTKQERDYLKKFYRDGGVNCELHYIDTPEEQRLLNIKKRNQQIINGKLDFYLVQEKDIYHDFEVPSDDEIDVKIGNNFLD